MRTFLKSYLFLFAISFFKIPFANAQEVRVIDNKGTITTIRNNNVYTSATNPNTASTIALENDLWIDTSTTPSTFKVWNNSNQWIPIEFGKSLFSIATTVVNPDVSFTPSNNEVNTNQWVNMDTALPTTSITVQAGDFVDVRVNISEDFPAVNNINGDTYNAIGDVFRFYATNPALIGSPTMIESLITGGNNSFEIAAGSLNQLFTVTENGTLTIGIQVKYNSSNPRVYSTDRSGRGGLQVIIYR
jgi:hypothetical protein